MPLRLKSLELHGYKTFASRTLFEFAPSVTAIVGPNGSGKSNIADSLRWVLGEQSYALLRGKKTEDMIFAGSEGRPRAGMASATITFDNCDAWLPIDFSEVAITRRAYRDGQNEYLINGQRVRLKDVSELLAQSGLAERTYTIIGQGLVDAALALKAEERRRLFEEAAGIGLHRARREEALRRLETTQRNLERVQDILAELQPRVRSLEKQARRAQEYEQVKADLRVLLRDWYGFHWHRAQKELTQAREAARVQEGSLAKARREQGALDERFGALSERLQSLRAGLNSWHRQSAQLHAQREGLSRDLAVADERARSLASQEQAAQSERAQLEEELGLHQERLAEADRESERLAGDLNEARSQVEAARQALAARQAGRAQAEKDLEAARRTLSSLTARQGQAQVRLSERQAQAERGQKAVESAAAAAAQAESALKAAEGRGKELLVKQQDAEAQVRAAEEAFQNQRKRAAALETQRQEALERRSAANAELARLKAQMDVLEQAEAALSGYAAGTRVLLQAARQARLPGARGALSSALEVPAELETAITAALGDYLDGVVLDHEPEAALDLLSGQSGRGVLLPLKLLKPGAPVAVPNGGSQEESESGVIGVAADLVSAPPELRPVVDLLLGPVLVVRDRRAARRALASLAAAADAGASLPSGARAVTLQGEVFLESGPVLAGGGPAGAEQTSGGQTLLGRQRQRRELARLAHEAGRQASELAARATGLEAELKSQQAETDRLGREQRQARQAAEDAAAAANQARLAVEQARQQARWQEEQCERLRADLARGEKEAAQLAHDLAALEGEIAQAREGVRSRTADLAGLALDEFQAQVSYWNTQAAVAERALADSKNRQREYRLTLERAIKTGEALEARAAELRRAQAALEEEKKTRRQAEGEIGGQIEALRVLIEPAEAELEGLEGEQASLQRVESEARQALTLAEHHNAQTKIALARRQEGLDSLQRRIEDDFGLVAFEYAEQVSGPTPLPLDGMVEQLPRLTQLPPEIEEAIKRQRAQLRRMGPVNPEAQMEYKEVKERFTFLTDQVRDLQAAEVGVREVIAELDALMQREFRKTFLAVAEEFKQIFTRLFGGGSARLVLTDPEDLSETGIDIEARLPGRRTQGLSLLSGGERSLTATALVFSLLKVSPTPFCVLDEVDAMLDEANVGRFRELLRELSATTQFLVVTHNRNTVQAADVIYGVTMGRDSASQVLSLKLDQVASVVED